MTADSTPLQVANTFIDRHANQVGIQHLKLQKLVYYCHSWWLSKNERSFIVEKPEVWRYGPVFSSMYSTLKGFGSQYIYNPVSYQPFYPAPMLDATDTFVMQFIDWIWGQYGRYSAGELSEKTHAPGTPWSIIAKKYNYNVPMHQTIDDATIKSCFSGNWQSVLKAQ